MFRKIWMCLFALSLALLATGCSNKTSDAVIQVMTDTQLTTALDGENHGVLLIDIRQPAAFASGHIPGAINIPISRLDRHQRDPLLTQAQKIVVYGNDWNDALPRAAVKKLIRLDFVDVYYFHGGLQAWEDSGRATSGPRGRRFMRPESR